MQLHGNAALTPNQRLRLARRVVEQGWSLGEAAEAAEVSGRTARKWVERYRAEEEAGLVGSLLGPRGSTPMPLRRIASRRSPRCGGCG